MSYESAGSPRYAFISKHELPTQNSMFGHLTFDLIALKHLYDAQKCCYTNKKVAKIFFKLPVSWQ